MFQIFQEKCGVAGTYHVEVFVHTIELFRIVPDYSSGTRIQGQKNSDASTSNMVSAGRCRM
jgi:hypothetical protein